MSANNEKLIKKNKCYWRQLFRFATEISAFYLRTYYRLRKIEVEGKENMPPLNTGGYIAVGNHRGTMDVFLFSSILKHNRVVPWITVSESDKDPIRSFIFSKYGMLKAIKIRRGKPNLRLKKAVEEAIVNDSVIWLAPEGTRSRTQVLGKGMPGVVWSLMQLGNVLIVPSSVINIDKPRGLISELLYPSRAKVKVGKPFRITATKDTKNNSKNKLLYEKVTDEVMFRIGETMPENLRGEYAFSGARPNYEYTTDDGPNT